MKPAPLERFFAKREGITIRANIKFQSIEASQ
jgi:hypothetical protein